MKALSLWQPWASLLMWAEKKFETRNWVTPYRGLLVIHASKTRLEVNTLLNHEALRGKPEFANAFAAHGVIMDNDLSYGAALGTVELVKIIPTNSVNVKVSFTPKERAFGDLSPDRYAWQMANPRPFPKPIPCPGKQSLWDFDDKLLDALPKVSLPGKPTQPRLFD